MSKLNVFLICLNVPLIKGRYSNAGFFLGCRFLLTRTIHLPYSYSDSLRVAWSTRPKVWRIILAIRSYLFQRDQVNKHYITSKWTFSDSYKSELKYLSVYHYYYLEPYHTFFTVLFTQHSPQEPLKIEGYWTDFFYECNNSKFKWNVMVDPWRYLGCICRGSNFWGKLWHEAAAFRKKLSESNFFLTNRMRWECL